ASARRWSGRGRRPKPPPPSASGGCRRGRVRRRRGGRRSRDSRAAGRSWRIQSRGNPGKLRKVYGRRPLLSGGRRLPFSYSESSPPHEPAMAKKKAETGPARSVTPERAVRLVRLVQMLGEGVQKRAAILRRLRINIRGFYRDLEVLRAAGADVELI